ncbi:hypothetical protein VTL71DRAFT_5117 [Oculimacula yallundae]|uniref:Uncharacterized protein n=1 Tax=Oculimacula yallundae TaxID=86028 RepID=A0ABR4C0U3_9HELO
MLVSIKEVRKFGKEMIIHGLSQWYKSLIHASCLYEPLINGSTPFICSSQAIANPPRPSQIEPADHSNSSKPSLSFHTMPKPYPARCVYPFALYAPNIE